MPRACLASSVGPYTKGRLGQILEKEFRPDLP